MKVAWKNDMGKYMSDIIVGVDPGLGSHRPGSGTGIAILYRSEGKWELRHSLLSEGRTDRDDRYTLLLRHCRALARVLYTYDPRYVFIEDAEYQGAMRAPALLGVSRLAGALAGVVLTHAPIHGPFLQISWGAKPTLGFVTRTQVLRHFRCKTSDDANRLTIATVDGIQDLDMTGCTPITEHEICAAAAAVVGFRYTQIDPRVTEGKTVCRIRKD